MSTKIPKGFAVAVAVGTGFAIGLGFISSSAPGRRRRTSPVARPESDSILMIEPLLDRLDRIDCCLSAVEARLTPVAASIAELDSRIQQNTRDIEALQVETIQARQENTDRDIARLASLLADVNHPLVAQKIVH
jgi:hypothetical protein